MGTISTAINGALFGEGRTSGTPGVWVAPATVDGSGLVTALPTVGAQAYYMMPRPGVPGTVVKVRDYETGADLADTALDAEGYFPDPYDTGESTAKLVKFSLDNWATELGPYATLEAYVAAIAGGAGTPGADGTDGTNGADGTNGIRTIMVRAASPVQGMVSDPIPIPVHETLLGVQLTEDSPGPTGTVTVQVTRDVGAGPENMYSSGARPSLTSGQTQSNLAAPTTADLPANATLRAQIDVAPSGGTGTLTVGTPTVQDPGTGVSSSFTVPIPAGVSAGQLIIGVVTALQDVSLPTADGSGGSNGFLQLAKVYTGVTNTITLLVVGKIATGTDTAPTLTTASGTPNAQASFAISGVPTTLATAVDSNVGTAENTSGTVGSPAASATGATITPGADGELIIHLVAARFGSNDRGLSLVADPATTQRVSRTPARTAGNTNVGLLVATEAGPAAGATTTARTTTHRADAALGNAAPAWVSGTTYAVNDLVRSDDAGGVNRVWKRSTAGAGTTVPRSDPTNWDLQGYAIRWAMATIGIKASSGSAGTGLAVHIHLRAV